jgi:hypothetical protein
MTALRFYPAVGRRFTEPICFVRSSPAKVSPPCFGSPAAGRFGPFAASLKHHIDGAFVLANAHLPDSQTSVSSFSAAVSPFNAHSSRSVRGGLVQHVFSLPSRWLSPCPSRYRPVCRAAKLKTLCVMGSEL